MPAVRTLLRAALIALLAGTPVQGQSERPSDRAGGPAPETSAKDQLDTANRYSRLARVLGERGKYKEAEELYRKALAIQLHILGEDHPGMAGIDNDLGTLLHLEGKHAEAESLHRRALAIRRRVHGEDHPDTARSYESLGIVLSEQGKVEESEQLLRKALAIRLRIHGEDHPQTASIYIDLAMVLDHQEKYAEAEALMRKALDILRRGRGEDHPETIIASNNLAGILTDQGKHAEAEPLFRNTLEICRRVHGDEHPDTALSWSNLAGAVQRRGQYAEAELLFRKTLMIRIRVFGPDHPYTARTYHSMATVLHNQGKNAEAESWLRKVLEIYLRVFGADHSETQGTYFSLAGILTDQGKYAEAEARYRKALDFTLRAHGEDHRHTGNVYNSLGRLFYLQGRHVEAEPLFRKALAISLRVHGENRDSAACYNNMETVLSAQHKHAEAESMGRKALEIRLRILGEGNPDTANSLYNMVHVLHAMRKDAEAETMALQAVRSFERVRRPVSHTGLERAAFSSTQSPLAILAVLLARRGAAQAAWQRLEASLARGLFEDLARPLEPGERRQEQELQGQLQRLDELVAARSSTQGQDETLRQRREAVQVELMAFEAGIEQKYGAAAGQSYDLAQIQQRLRDDAALVAWLEIDPSSSPDPAGDHWACIVRRRGGPIWVQVRGSGPGGACTQDDHTRPARVAKAIRIQPEERSKDWKSEAGALAAQQLGPLDAHLGPRDDLPAARHLVILTSPMLAGLPIEALLEARPPDRPRYTVTYAPSGTMLAWLRERPRARPDRGLGAGPRRVLALGDPQFESAAPPNTPAPPPAHDLVVQRVAPGSTAAGGGIAPGPAPLPGTRREVEAIARLFDHPEVILGPDASEARLDSLASSDSQGLRRFDILHFATHGILDPQASMRSALLLAAAPRSDSFERALKGQPVHDGELTAEQILRTWKLDAELVTLSACETALGQQTGGEGYLGFSQALFLAGARSLVLSLWKVDDRATSLLMIRFYENLLGRRTGLNQPLPRGEALAEAKQWLRGLTADQALAAHAALKRGEIRPSPGGEAPKAAPAQRPYEHPYYWAAFILVGDPWGGGEQHPGIPAARQPARDASAPAAVPQGDLDTAIKYNQRATDLTGQGKHAEAEPLFRQVLEIRRRVQGEDHPDTATAYNNLASSLTDQGKYAEAGRLLKQALAIRRRVLGADHLDTAHSDNELGHLLWLQGKHAEAEPLFQQALKIFRRTVGEDDPRTALACNNLACALEGQHKHAEAEPLFKQALEIRRRTLGDDHPETAASFYCLASALVHRGNYAEAEPLLRKAQAVQHRTLGEDHLQTLMGDRELAWALARQGKSAEAEPLLARVLAISRRTLGEEHPWTAECYSKLGAILDQQSKPAQTERMHRQALAIRRRILGEDHADTTTSYEDLAGVLQRQGQYAEAETLYRKVLEILRRARNEDGRDTATGYSNLAIVLYEQGKYAEAETLHRKALEIRRRVLGEEHVETAASCNNLAGVLYEQGKYAEAETYCRRALEIKRRILGADHPGMATSYNTLALVLDGQGKYAAAEALYRRSLEIVRQAHGENSLDAAAAYGNLAVNLNHQDKDTEAEPLARHALEIRRRILGEDHPETATSYNNLASVLDDQGKFAEAETLYGKALEIRRRTLGEDHPDTATAYDNLASSLRHQGKYAEVRQLLQKALEIHRRTLRADHPDLVLSYSNLAGLFEEQGRHAEAEPLYRAVLEIRRRTLGEDHPDTARSYNNLAGVLGEQRRYAESESLYRRALEITRRALGNDHPQTANRLSNVGWILGQQGKHADAEPLDREALEIRRRTLGEDHPDTAMSYNNLAACLAQQGRSAKAEPLCRQALAINRRMLGEGHPDTLDSYNLLAMIVRDQGKLAEAEPLYRAAVRGYEAARQRAGNTGLERTSFMARYSPQASLAGLLARGGQPVSAWKHLEASRARGLFDDVARPLDLQEQRREQELRTRCQRIDEQLAALASARAVEGLQRTRGELLQRREHADSELTAFEAEMERKYGAAAGQPYDLARIQRQIPADTALVAWLDLASLPRAADPRGLQWACLVRSRGEPAWVDLTGGSGDGRWTTADARQRIARHLAALRTAPEGRPVDWRTDIAELAAERFDLLDAHLGPRNGLPAARHLVILTSPLMATIPIEALLEARPPGRPRYTVSYAPSGTTLAWLRERPAGEAVAKHRPVRLFALGDPVFEPAAAPEAPEPEPEPTPAPSPPAPPARQSAPPAAAAPRVAQAEPRPEPAPGRLRGETPAALPGTRPEIEAIARLFDQPAVLLGADASEARLDTLTASDALRGFDFLHFATHGVLNPQFALRSALLLTPDPHSEEPARVLAGQPVHDGVVTAEQILRTWKLDAQLVTLSACETALGQHSGGEGELGFARALFLAGARSLVLSLWKVDDRATSLLMVRFYENLLGKRPGLDRPLPKALALSEAKQWLRGLTTDEVAALSSQQRGKIRPAIPEPRQPDAARPSRPYEHPYYWAAFILLGDPW
jgi:CHAT domain-containing protein/Tfp pilus assembly protein PilF